MRAGYLVVGAMILGLAAVGVLVWTNTLNLTPSTSIPPQASAPASPQSSDLQWVQRMKAVVSGGGFAATFADNGVQGWRLPEGYRLERFSIDGGRVAFARLSSSKPRSNELETWAERGLSYQFPVDLNNRSSGGRLEIGVVARRAQTNSSDYLYAAYATQQAGHSGWQRLQLLPQFNLQTFVFNVPAAPAGYSNQPIIVLHSDDTASGRAAEIIGVYVKQLPPQ
jgi:hypothetical protein